MPLGYVKTIKRTRSKNVRSFFVIIQLFFCNARARTKLKIPIKGQCLFMTHPSTTTTYLINLRQRWIIKKKIIFDNATSTRWLTYDVLLRYTELVKICLQKFWRTSNICASYTRHLESEGMRIILLRKSDNSDPSARRIVCSKFLRLPYTTTGRGWDERCTSKKAMVLMRIRALKHGV